VQSVAVIGAGIVGTSIAYHLSRSARTEVVLIDSSLPGGGTSDTGMAWLNASNKRPRDYFELNFAGVREYHDMKRELGVDWVHVIGSIASEFYTPKLIERMGELAAWGYRVERLTGTRVAEAFGTTLAVHADDETFAHYPDEGWIDVPAALRFMLARAADHRHFVYRAGGSVIGLERQAGSIRVTLSDGTAFTTHQVVNAAGPRADRIARLLGRDLPMAPTRGMTLVLREPDVRLDKVVLSSKVGIRPDGPGLFRVHDETVDGMIAQGAPVDRGELAEELHKRAVSLVPSLADATIVRESIGVRSIPADSFSSIGRVRDLPGYIEAVTHSGVTMGPLVGRIVAGIALGDTGHPLLTERFSPDRFEQQEKRH
jgi:glycine/D-amino acid oxidase-like deaminating enzyme